VSAKRPALALVREGNAGHHSADRLEGGVRLKPRTPDEPSWAKVLPAVKGDKRQQGYVNRLRAAASAEWRRVTGELTPQGLLALIDESLLLDHCVAVAIAHECYRDLAVNGLTVLGERGWQKNGAATILAQQRDRLKHTVVQLGASPLARDALNPRGGSDDEGSPFD
jgi:P27 family predicted phage terminase small subunit